MLKANFSFFLRFRNCAFGQKWWNFINLFFFFESKQIFLKKDVRTLKVAVDILCQHFIVQRLYSHTQCSCQQGTHKYMNEQEDTYVAVVEKCTVDGAITFTLMKHKHKGHTNEWRHPDYYNVVLRWLPSTPIYKMYKGVGDCEEHG